MKQKRSILLCLCVVATMTSFAQLSREDKDDKNQAREARMAKKNDYALFRRQILGLKEYAAEKKKIPALQKTNKGAVKVTAFIDSNENDEDAKTLIGYIRQDVGDNTTNMYEVTYDRATKKIVSVKRTPEAADADKEQAEEKEEKAEEKADKKADKKKTTTAKKQKDDDDDDPEDEKPAKKSKEKDDD